MLLNIFCKRILFLIFLASATSSSAMEHKTESIEIESTFTPSLSSCHPVTDFPRNEELPKKPLMFDIFHQGMITDKPLCFIDSKYFVSSRYSLIPLMVKKESELPASVVILFANQANSKMKQFWGANIAAETLYAQGEKMAEIFMENMAKSFINRIRSNIDGKKGIIFSGDEKLLALVKKSFCKELSIEQIETVKTTSTQVLLDKQTGTIHMFDGKVLLDHILNQIPNDKPGYYTLV